MKMSNQFYDKCKWIVLVFLPAFAVLISGVGDLYQWMNTSDIVTTINLITVFLGSLLQLSSQNYHDNNHSSGGGGSLVEICP